MADIHTGSCLCGAVRFKTSGKLRGVVYCHCSQCRKQSGHYYAATNVSDADFEVTGDENLTWYNASDAARRGFCKVCGSALFWKHNEAAEISIMAGSFDQPSGLKGERHIFVEDKGEYYEIDDGLPCHARSTTSIRIAND